MQAPQQDSDRPPGPDTLRRAAFVIQLQAGQVLTDGTFTTDTLVETIDTIEVLKLPVRLVVDPTGFEQLVACVGAHRATVLQLIAGRSRLTTDGRLVAVMSNLDLADMVDVDRKTIGRWLGKDPQEHDGTPGDGLLDCGFLHRQAATRVGNRRLRTRLWLHPKLHRTADTDHLLDRLQTTTTPSQSAADPDSHHPQQGRTQPDTQTQLLGAHNPPTHTPTVGETQPDTHHHGPQGDVPQGVRQQDSHNRQTPHDLPDASDSDDEGSDTTTHPNPTQATATTQRDQTRPVTSPGRPVTPTTQRDHNFPQHTDGVVENHNSTTPGANSQQAPEVAGTSPQHPVPTRPGPQNGSETHDSKLPQGRAADEPADAAAHTSGDPAPPTDVEPATNSDGEARTTSVLIRMRHLGFDNATAFLASHQLHDDLDRVEAWLDHIETAADINGRAAYLNRVLRTDDWPQPTTRRPKTPQPTRPQPPPYTPPTEGPPDPQHETPTGTAADSTAHSPTSTPAPAQVPPGADPNRADPELLEQALAGRTTTVALSALAANHPQAATHLDQLDDTHITALLQQAAQATADELLTSRTRQMAETQIRSPQLFGIMLAGRLAQLLTTQDPTSAEDD